MSTKNNSNAFKRFTSFCVSIMQKYLPDPYIFCALLTFIVFIGTMVFTKQTPMAIIGHWTKGAKILTRSLYILCLINFHSIYRDNGIYKTNTNGDHRSLDKGILVFTSILYANGIGISNWTHNG